MLNIIINEANKGKIENLLENAQKRANVRKFSIENIYSFPKKIKEYQENHCICWADLEGCKFSFDTYSVMPNCYKYNISYTNIEITIEKGKCRVTNIERLEDSNKRYNAHKNQCIYMTERAKCAIIENAKYF